MTQPSQQDHLLEMKMTDDLKEGFSGLAQWIRYSAWVGFLSALYSLVSGVYIFLNPDILESSSSTSTLVGNFIGLIISIYVNTLLWKASTRIYSGIQASDQSDFSNGLGNLARYFRVLGVISIIVLVIVSLFLIIMGLSATALR